MRITTGSGSYERFGLGVGDDYCLSTNTFSPAPIPCVGELFPDTPIPQLNVPTTSMILLNDTRNRLVMGIVTFVNGISSTRVHWIITTTHCTCSNAGVGRSLRVNRLRRRIGGQRDTKQYRVIIVGSPYPHMVGGGCYCSTRYSSRQHS